MNSRWSEVRSKATFLRKKGHSIRNIEKLLGVRRSTLSGWFKNVNLSIRQRKKLQQNKQEALVVARKKALLWHRNQKKLRLEIAEKESVEIVKKLKITDLNLLKLALSMLYLGEGHKKGFSTSLGNSNPLIMRFFVDALVFCFNVDRREIKGELHLRSDQDSKKMKFFWARKLSIPIKNFTNVSFDKRTVGKSTYPDYYGVCALRCGKVAIQRQLLYLSEKFCNKVINELGA